MALNTGLFNVTPGETQKDVDWRRRLALQLMMQGVSAEPIQHWTQGAARIAQALTGGYELYRADEADKEKQKALAEMFRTLPGMGGNVPASTTPPVPPPAVPIPNEPLPSTPSAPRTIPVAASGSPADTISKRFEPVYGALQSGEFDPMGRNNMSPVPPSPGSNAPIQPTPVRTQAIPPTPAAQVSMQPQLPTPLPAARQAPQIPLDVQQAIIKTGASPTTAPMAASLYSQYSTPKEQWVPLQGQKGVLVNTATGERKADPGNMEYSYFQREDGSVIGVNKNDPSDVHIIQGRPDQLAAYHGRKAQATEVGQQIGKNEVNLPAAIQNGEIALDTIEQIRKHPGRWMGTGMAGALTTLGGLTEGTPGTEQRGFIQLVGQARGGAFLNAYQLLRGGGQISDAEGRKAEIAIARMDRAQDTKDFEAALNDYRDVIKTGIERAKAQAGQLHGSYQYPSDELAAQRTKGAKLLKQKYGLE